MFVPFLLVLASLAALVAAVLVPGYDQLILLAVPLLLAALILLGAATLRRKPAEPQKAPKQRQRVTRRKPGPPIMIDGSNVLHWKDNEPQIASVRQVVDLLTAQGYSPGVVFDATVGYQIGTRYRDDAEMAAHLGLPTDRVLVVPKGTPADPVLLATARQLGAPIVTNDRYRDWAQTYPEVRTPGLLIRGGYQEGKLWLDLTQAATPKS